MRDRYNALIERQDIAFRSTRVELFYGGIELAGLCRCLPRLYDIRVACAIDAQDQA